MPKAEYRLKRREGGEVGGKFTFVNDGVRQLFYHYAHKLQAGRRVNMSLARVYENKSNAQLGLYRGEMLPQLLVGLEDMGWDGLPDQVGKDGLVRPIPLNVDTLHAWLKQEFAVLHKADYPNWQSTVPFSLADADVAEMSRFMSFVKAFAFGNSLRLYLP